MGEDLLDNLLSVGAELLSKEETNAHKELKEINLFDKADSDQSTKPKEQCEDIVHRKDIDFSDDESENYNECGKAINSLLKLSNDNCNNSSILAIKTIDKPLSIVKPKITDKEEVTNLPFFGIRVVKPLISSQLLSERMQEKDIVTMLKLKNYAERGTKDKNWVIAGVVVSKSASKVSQKGSNFLIWVLSDLHFDLKTASVFLFGKAYKELWKTATGTVVAILNPNILEKKSNSKDEVCLSITNAQHVMILGQSKDLGTCRSIKKDGTPCTAFVNSSHCDYCVYHVKQEYQKSSRRSDLQSNFTGHGLTALRNKVLGKNEVFYAGKSYTAIPARKSQKLASKDEQRLRQLSGQGTSANRATSLGNKIGKKSAAAMLDVSYKQRAKDLELLQRLGGSFTTTNKQSIESAEKTQITVPVASSKLAANVLSRPSLGNFNTIDLNNPILRSRKNIAKLNAIKYVQQNGPLTKQNPMNTRGSGVKRGLEESDKTDENEPKKQKNNFFSDRFKKIMAATSKHVDLLEQVEDEQQEKYFNKLEAKEQMEEKMTQTFKMNCKAVRCLKCKYTNFSASDTCKADKHPLKVFDAVKRFFMCGDCGNRTVVLSFVPTESCRNCGSGKWQKTSMMKERNVEKLHSLSIRGGEQTFLNSAITNSNLDLLVPDE